MPIVKVPDESGHTMSMISCKGRCWSPEFNEEAIENMSDFPLREDDVLLCSYSKSGCHWVWEILRILLNGKISSEDKIIHKEDYMMEWRPYKEYSSLPSPRVLNNHMPFELLPHDVLVKKPKVVFVYRNFKDVAVSFFHHHKGIRGYEYEGDFKSHTKMLVAGKTDNGCLFEYIRGWEKGIADNPELPVFVCSYEDLKENNLSEVRRLSKFIGKDYSDEFLQQVCDYTTFDKMKEVKGENSYQTKEGKPVMYRKGQVGDWKNHFTVALSEWFDEVIQRKTAGSKLKFRYTI